MILSLNLDFNHLKKKLKISLLIMILWHECLCEKKYKIDNYFGTKATF